MCRFYYIPPSFGVWHEVATSGGELRNFMNLEPIARSSLSCLQSKYLLGFFLVRLEPSRRACGAGFGLVEGGLGGELVDVGGSRAALGLMNFPFLKRVWPASA